MILDTVVYADGRRVAYETLEEAVRARHGPNTFVAVALHEPDRKELGLIADELGLSKQLMGNAINPPHRAGIPQYENLLSIWLASVRYPGVEEGVRIGWICMFSEEGLLITLHFGEGLGELKNVRRRVEVEPEQLWETPLDVLRETVDLGSRNDSASARASPLYANSRTSLAPSASRWIGKGSAVVPTGVGRHKACRDDGVRRRCPFSKEDCQELRLDRVR